METQHLAKMLDFVDRFLEPIASAGTRLVEAKGQLQEQMLNNSADRLLTDWVQRNGTGDEVPQPIEESLSAFMDLGGSAAGANADNQSLNNLFSLNSQQSLEEKSAGTSSALSPASPSTPGCQQLQQQADSSGGSGGTRVRDIFSSLIPGRLSRAGKEEKSSGASLAPAAVPTTPTSPEPKVDAEGFIERDEARDHEEWRRRRGLSGNGEKSSDSDSDDSDTEQAAGGIGIVRINPVNQKRPDSNASDLFSASARLVLSPPPQSSSALQPSPSRGRLSLGGEAGGGLSGCGGIGGSDLLSLDDFQPSIQWDSSGPSSQPQPQTQRQRPASAMGPLPQPPRPSSRPGRRPGTPDWAAVSSAGAASQAASAVPLAVLISECLHCRWSPARSNLNGDSSSASTLSAEDAVCLSGSTCRLKAQGSLTVSFPASVALGRGSATAPSQLPALAFRLTGLPGPARGAQRLVKEQAPQADGSVRFETDPAALTDELIRLAREKPGARFLNLELLAYDLPLPAGFEAPVRLGAVWRCRPDSTELRVTAELQPNCPLSIQTVAISAEVTGGVTEMRSEPPGRWQAGSSSAQWEELRLPVRLQANFSLTAGPSSPGLVRLRFQADGRCISDCSFAAVGAAYRLAMDRRRLVSGQYAAEPG
ncbi:hypothetical protein BOX15_Mlig008568g1 [Macrostomum lignano]|uniref:Muniscin C-terminal domain-containing protein n=1 Tax=Macrostomum lignano TaxID=282301 RepID=A0A267GSN3_9PLAT|nr:hypothetical protein BOX15_Mlig008568g1 [Macrostomum lignano]